MEREQEKLRPVIQIGPTKFLLELESRYLLGDCAVDIGNHNLVVVVPHVDEAVTGASALVLVDRGKHSLIHTIIKVQSFLHLVKNVKRADVEMHRSAIGDRLRLLLFF